MTTTALLLIPGFFGFGRFQGRDGFQIEYFAGIADSIALTGKDVRVLVHEPPPTGSLDARVASLHDAVLKVLAGDALPHNDPFKATRIHLIGHSAGGVDARLYTRPDYRWAGGPAPEQRAHVLKAIGDVVTLSAPFHGTPIATFARSERDVFLLAVMAYTIFGRIPLAGNLLIFLIGALLRGTSRGDQLNTIATFLESLRDRQGDQLIDEINAFFTLLLEDRRLLGDLSVESMTIRNAKLTGSDHPRLRSYVSVSPAPHDFLSTAGIASLFKDSSDLAQRFLYAHLYQDTGSQDSPGKVPQLTGDVLQLGASLDEQLALRRASDGVVPVTSQTLDGKPAGVVLGDHLDVTGHFENNGDSLNVFKTGANFDKSRLDALWKHIANNLTD
jgi:triacylglycerol lipase